MNPSHEAAERSWFLTQIDVLLCALPISFFLSVVCFM
jgi:hypothetical protein